MVAGAAFDLHVVGTGGPHGRHGEGGPGADVKLRAVAGAGDRVVSEFAVSERATIVRADIVEGIELAVAVKQRHHFAIDFDERLAGIGDLGDRADTNEFRHGR